MWLRSSLLLFGFAGIGNGKRLSFGAFLDATELTAPEAFEFFGPFVKRANGFGIGAVKHVAAVAAYGDQADLMQDAQVLGDGGLLESQRGNDIADGPFLQSEEIKD